MTPGREPEAVVEPLGRFLWTSFDDGAVLFDQLTGDTHALDIEHADALRRVLGAGSPPEGAAADAGAAPTLAHLRSLGLI